MEQKGTVKGSRLLCQEYNPEKSTGGIIIPESAEQTSAFEVVMVGEDVEDFERGDLVWIPNGSRIVTVTIFGNDYDVINADMVVYHASDS